MASDFAFSTARINKIENKFKRMEREDWIEIRLDKTLNDVL